MENKEYTYKEFVDSASHELQAPIRKLSVFVDKLSTLCEGEQAPQVREYITRVHSCLEQMRSLVDELCEWSGIHSQELNPAACDAYIITKEILVEMQDDLEIKKAFVQCGQLPILIGNRDQLKLLFKNLLSNAVKFRNPTSPLKVEISSQPLSDAGTRSNGLNPSRSYAKIRVQDNGIGLRPGEENQLFRPFGRLNGKSEYPGNGLGLAMCKTIVENHQGRLYAEGGDSGSCFTVILPEIPEQLA